MGLSIRLGCLRLGKRRLPSSNHRGFGTSLPGLVSNLQYVWSIVVDRSYRACDDIDPNRLALRMGLVERHAYLGSADHTCLALARPYPNNGVQD
jgi:hypothetical protein